MSDLNERDAKLVQYLSEAYGKEQELETALEAHIAMTTKAPYKKRLKQHLQRDQSARQSSSSAGSRSSAAAGTRSRPWSARRPRPRRARCTWSAAAASRRRC